LTPVPKGYFSAPGTSLDIKPLLSEDDAYDAIIGPEGGTMIAEGPDLTVYTLTIPPNALVEPTEITMTPLKSASGLPFARGLAAGVHFGPSGTWFLRPARLSIRPRQALPSADVTPFAYGGQGENMHLTPYRVEGDRVVVFLDHFSGQGIALSTAQERAVELARAPLGVREKLTHKGAEILSELNRGPGAERVKALLDALEQLQEAYRQEVLEPIRRQAAKNCTMGALYLLLTLAMDKQLEVLVEGERTGEGKNTTAFGADYVKQCLKEEYEQCLRTGDFKRIEMWYMAYVRQLEVITGSSAAAQALEKTVNQYVRSCACYEVEFDSTLVMSGKLEGGSFGLLASGPITNSYAAALKAKATAAFTEGSPIAITDGGPDTGTDRPGIFGFAPLEYTRYEMDGAGSIALALFADNQGTAHGYTNDCVSKGVGTKPGVLTVVRVDPGFKEPEKRKYPLVAPSDMSEGAQAIRILRQLPEFGLLAPPRVLDPTATIVWVAPKEVVELERQTCKLSTGVTTTEEREATLWLERWRRWLNQLNIQGHDGQPVMVSDLEGPKWTASTDSDLRWHDLKTERSEFGTVIMEATVTVRHTPTPLTSSPGGPE